MFRPGRRRHLTAACIFALAASACSDSTAPRPAVTPSPAHLVAVSGDWQLALQGRSVALPLKVLATDAANRPLPGVTVEFTVAAGGGAIPGDDVVTDASGVATSGAWTLGAIGSQLVIARAGKHAAVFTATALPSDAVPPTPSDSARPPGTTPPPPAPDTSTPPLGSLRGRLGFLRDGAVALSDADGTPDAPLVRLADLTRLRATVALSPERSRIAFVVAPTGDICIARSDGPDVRCAGEMPGFDYFSTPAWSPDGSKVLYGAGRNSPGGVLFLLDTKTMSRVPIVSEEKGWGTFGASWSPDGRKFSYVVQDVGFYIGDPNGSERKLVYRSTPTASVASARWSPDGRKLAVTMIDQNRCPWFCDTAVGVLDPEGPSIRILAEAQTRNELYVGSWSGEYGAPIWSPDGATIAYGRADCSRSYDPCQMDVMVVAAAGGGSRVLLPNAELLGWWP